MEQGALAILDRHCRMAVSTVRADGWPQTTIVGYANVGFSLYFLVFRDSQKLVNIQREPRVSIAVGGQEPDLRLARAVYAGAVAAEVGDSAERDRGWALLAGRHGDLANLGLPDPTETAMLRADCRHVSLLDYTRGLGHTEEFTLGES